MSRIFIFFIAFILFSFHSRAQTCTAVGMLTLNPGAVGPIGAHMMVTYNPLKNVYYWNSGGFGSNPIATYSSTGGNTIAVGMGNQDWRGLWWNSNNSSIEGNCFNSAGIFTINIDPITGYAGNGSNIILSNNQPNPQSGGQYDAINDQVIYYSAFSILKYSRSSGLLVSTVPIIGLPGGIGNISSYGFFTGNAGMEYAIYDYTNRRAYTINYNTGAYVSTIQFPLTAGAPSGFGLAYANGLYFIYDGNKWVGYRAGLWAEHTAPVCIGQEVQITAYGASSYTWNTGSNSNSIVVNPISTVIYTVNGNSGNSCISVFTISIPVIPVSAPSIAISGSSNVCIGSTKTLSASGVSTYSWSTGSNNFSITVSPTVSSTYSVIGSNSVGCHAKATFSINALDSPTVQINGNSILCEGESTTLTATGAPSYSWNTGANSESISISPSVTTVYTVIGTFSNSCSDTKTINVTVNLNPIISINGSTNVCSGKSATLSATGANNYTWSTGSTLSFIVISPTAAISYSVYGESISGCPGSNSVNINVSASPTISVFSNTNTACAGNSITLFANGADSYSWSTNQVTQTIIVTAINNTTYTVIGTNTVNNCATQNQIAISVLGSPTLNVSYPAIVCLGETVTLTVSGADTYTWSTGSNSTIVIDTPTLGTSYTIAGTNSIGCTSSYSLQMVVAVCNQISQLIYQANQTTIYPNPNNGVFTLMSKSSSSQELKLYDLNGKCVLSQKLIDHLHEIQADHLAEGCYILKLNESNGIMREFKLFIKK
ncbi:MAG: T9SS type A sorting domain-containing protein [Sphingobacteriaceae bacterium]|nr:T9SS type A sorting domain-containing protein [Sphingobacteriaceae bacterium]